MKLRYEVVSHHGLVRENNEDMACIGGQTVRDDSDAFEFDIPADGMKFGAIVCDGLGGHVHGEVASELACNLFEKFVDELPEGLSANELIMRIKQWFRHANEAILAESHGDGMATTMTGLLIYFNQAYILNCGDSRTYRLRHDNFMMLSRDHAESANMIYNCLGIPNPFIDITPVRVIEGDCYMICSDGLSDYVEAADIERDADSAHKLLDDALAAGAPDNVTVITIRIF